MTVNFLYLSDLNDYKESEHMIKAPCKNVNGSGVHILFNITVPFIATEPQVGDQIGK